MSGTSSGKPGSLDSGGSEAGSDLGWMLRGPATFAAAVFAVCLVVMSYLGAPTPKALAKVESVKTTQPGSLLIIQDVSGSMSGFKMRSARGAIEGVLDKMPTDSSVGLLPFADKARLLVDPVPGGASKLRGLLPSVGVGARNVANHLWAHRGSGGVGGGTDIAKALREAGRELDTRNWAGPARFILVSDGASSRNDALAAARELARSHPELRCETIGISLNSSGARLLREIAEILGGKSWNVNGMSLGRTLEEAAGLRSLTGFEQVSRDGQAASSFPMAMAGLLLLVGGGLASAFRRKENESAFLVSLCVAGGAMGWLATHVILPHRGVESAVLSLVQSGAYFMIVGTVLGMLLASQEDIFMGNSRRAADLAHGAFPLAVMGGAFAGFAGQGLFLTASGAGYGAAVLVFGMRVLGWSLAGAVIGACPGVANKSRRLTLDGAVGGALGGFVGGWLFEIGLRAVGTSGLPRLLALGALAAAIAWAVKAVREHNKVAWFTLLKGGPEGKKFLLSKPITYMGSHYQDDICVRAKVPGKPIREARLVQDGNGFRLESVGGVELEVNHRPVTSARLRDGDLVKVGSSTLRFGSQIVSREGDVDPYEVMSEYGEDPGMMAEAAWEQRSAGVTFVGTVEATPDDGEWVMDVVPAGQRVAETDDDEDDVTFL